MMYPDFSLYLTDFFEKALNPIFVVQDAGISWFLLHIRAVTFEYGITRDKVLAKCSGKLPFSEYLGLQSDALEFSNVSNAWTNMWNNKMMEEKAGVEAT